MSIVMPSIFLIFFPNFPRSNKLLSKPIGKTEKLFNVSFYSLCWKVFKLYVFRICSSEPYFYFLVLLHFDPFTYDECRLNDWLTDCVQLLLKFGMHTHPFVPKIFLNVRLGSYNNVHQVSWVMGYIATQQYCSITALLRELYVIRSYDGAFFFFFLQSVCKMKA